MDLAFLLRSIVTGTALVTGSFGVAVVFFRARTLAAARHLVAPDRARYDALWAELIAAPGAAESLDALQAATTALCDPRPSAAPRQYNLALPPAATAPAKGAPGGGAAAGGPGDFFGLVPRPEVDEAVWAAEPDVARPVASLDQVTRLRLLAVGAPSAAPAVAAEGQCCCTCQV